MKSNQIKQTFESIQADSNLADRVLNTAAGEPLHRKGPREASLCCRNRVSCRSVGDRRGRLRSYQFQLFCLSLGETTATGIPLPGPTAAHRELNIPTPESLVMVSRPKAWKAQSRRLTLSVEGNGYTLDIHEWHRPKRLRSRDVTLSIQMELTTTSQQQRLANLFSNG